MVEEKINEERKRLNVRKMETLKRIRKILKVTSDVNDDVTLDHIKEYVRNRSDLTIDELKSLGDNIKLFLTDFDYYSTYLQDLVAEIEEYLERHNEILMGLKETKLYDLELQASIEEKLLKLIGQIKANECYELRICKVKVDSNSEDLEKDMSLLLKIYPKSYVTI